MLRKVQVFTSEIFYKTDFSGIQPSSQFNQTSKVVFVSFLDKSSEIF